LLIYFDEKNAIDCGNCDVCIERKKSEKSTILNDLNTQIVNMIIQKPLTIQDVVSVFYRYDKSVVIEMINQLIEQNVLQIDDNRLLSCKKSR
jgi:ATP-dependent DNA helicase RecQ